MASAETGVFPSSVSLARKYLAALESTCEVALAKPIRRATAGEVLVASSVLAYLVAE
jgi:hypothetical protein